MIVPKVKYSDSIQVKYNKTSIPSKVPFGLNSNLLSKDTNLLLDKVINKYNKKTQLFADTLQTSQKNFEKKQGAIIYMPHKIGVLSSFETGIRATLKLEVPLPNGVKLRFYNDKGYKGEYASLEKVIAGEKGEEHLKYEISNDWIEVLHDDKKKNIVYTTTQLPSYQMQIFKGMNSETFSDPKVYAAIQMVDNDVAECLKPFLQQKQGLLERIIKFFGSDSSNSVGVKKYSSF